jgi:hypothetical protein
MDELNALDAIQARLDQVYPGLQSQGWKTAHPWSLGGAAPLDWVSVYEIDQPPHWHYVSYGMSSWGFEFSFRLARGLEAEPPKWPWTFLQRLGRYVFDTGDPFGPEHYVPWGKPITDAEPTALVALVFSADPMLDSVAVGGERLVFLSPIGITAAEYQVCVQDRPEAVLTELLSGNPLGVVNLQRGCPT